MKFYTAIATLSLLTSTALEAVKPVELLTQEVIKKRKARFLEGKQKVEAKRGVRRDYCADGLLDDMKRGVDRADRLNQTLDDMLEILEKRDEFILANAQPSAIQACNEALSEQNVKYVDDRNVLFNRGIIKREAKFVRSNKFSFEYILKRKAKLALGKIAEPTEAQQHIINATFQAVDKLFCEMTDILDQFELAALLKKSEAEGRVLRKKFGLLNQEYKTHRDASIRAGIIKKVTVRSGASLRNEIEKNKHESQFVIKTLKAGKEAIEAEKGRPVKHHFFDKVEVDINAYYQEGNKFFDALLQTLGTSILDIKHHELTGEQEAVVKAKLNEFQPAWNDLGKDIQRRLGFLKNNGFIPDSIFNNLYSNIQITDFDEDAIDILTSFELSETLPEDVKEIKGFLGAEHWGMWTTDKQVSFTFAKPLSKKVAFTFKACAYGPNVGKDFIARLGNEEKKFQILWGYPETRVEFENNDTGANTIVFEIPEPTSPAEGQQPLGMGLVWMDVEGQQQPSYNLDLDEGFDAMVHEAFVNYDADNKK